MIAGANEAELFELGRELQVSSGWPRRVKG
jgi:hypothetical protein